MKRGLLVVLAACLLFAVAAPANAASTWHGDVTINFIGPSGSSVVISLTDNATTPSFTSKAFAVDEDAEDRLLATGLTALSLGNRTGVVVDIDKAILYKLYIYNE